MLFTIQTERKKLCSSCSVFYVEKSRLNFARLSDFLTLGNCETCSRENVKLAEHIETFHSCPQHACRTVESNFNGEVCLQCSPFLAQRCFVCRAQRFECSC